MATETLSEEQKVLLQTFDMPTVEHGESVAWHPTGIANRSPETGIVIRVSNRNVHVLTARNGVREAVRHITDPKLKLNSDQRESGAWDFTDAHKKRESEYGSLLERISKLESQVSSVIVDSQKAETGSVLSEYQKLRKRAVDAGIEFTKNPPRIWLVEQLNSREKLKE